MFNQIPPFLLTEGFPREGASITAACACVSQLTRLISHAIRDKALNVVASNPVRTTADVQAPSRSESA